MQEEAIPSDLACVAPPLSVETRRTAAADGARPHQPGIDGPRRRRRLIAVLTAQLIQPQQPARPLLHLLPILLLLLERLIQGLCRPLAAPPLTSSPFPKNNTVSNLVPPVECPAPSSARPPRTSCTSCSTSRRRRQNTNNFVAKRRPTLARANTKAAHAFPHSTLRKVVEKVWYAPLLFTRQTMIANYHSTFANNFAAARRPNSRCVPAR